MKGAVRKYIYTFDSTGKIQSQINKWQEFWIEEIFSEKSMKCEEFLFLKLQEKQKDFYLISLP